MKIRQVSVFVENRTGRLYDVAKFLGENNINMMALSLADTVDFGIIRFIVRNPEDVYTFLKTNRFSVGLNDVLAVVIPDEPGGLARVLEVCAKNDVNVEYMYAFSRNANSAVLILRFDDIDKAKDALLEENIKLLDENSLYNL